GAGFIYFGQLAQSVEQRTENPRVPGSIPGLATKSLSLLLRLFLLFKYKKSIGKKSYTTK
ncbi:MAG: hypothetical protein K0R06_2649, partial [Clostridium sp.]|nr:hypothetical protein [Clostridium sp.]